MTLRNSIAEQRWIAALDQRERRVWTQLVCVLHARLVSGAMCDSVCVTNKDGVGVCWINTAQPIPCEGGAVPGLSHLLSSLLWLSSGHVRVLWMISEPIVSLRLASCCAVNLLRCWPNQSEVECKWDLTLLRPAEGAKTSTSLICPLLSIHL